MQKTNKFKLLALLLSLFFILGSLELFSFLYLKVTNLYPVTSFKSFYNREATGAQSYEPQNTAFYKKLRMPHPYFGHVYYDGNNYGFHDPKPFPYHAKSDEFVVGVFGGSTARHFGEYLDQKQVWELAKKNSGKKVVIVNFALGGMKQPQSFYVASRFLEYVNAAIILDGWNEAQAAKCPYPIEYPEGYAVLFNTKSNSKAFLDLADLERSWRDKNQMLQSGPLIYSPTVFLVWSQQKTQMINKSLQLRKVIEASDGREQDKFEECPGALEADNQLRYDTWKKYYTYFQLLADHLKVPVHQFLQPNPYVPGAKPLSPEEKKTVDFEMATTQGPYSQASKAMNFRSYYLKDHLSNTHDLTEVFKNTTQSVYIDQYTHLNEMGYDILQRRIRAELEKAHIF